MTGIALENMIAAVPNCTFCGAVFAPATEQDDCPKCGQPSRTRALPLVWQHVVQGALPGPLLGFAMSGKEREFLEPRFSESLSVSLYGDYGKDHVAGVDVRDLSRYPAGKFGCVFSLLLFDYFTEHDKALAEISRVLAPGGLFLTAILDARILPDATPPRISKMIQPKPGYFDYVPADAPLPSIRVGRDWFAAAMARAGMQARHITVEDAISHGANHAQWFAGVKKQKAA